MTAAPASYTFLYKAMTPTGGSTFGFRGAASELALADELKRQELLLLRAWKMPGGARAPESLPAKDEAALNDQLAILLSRGVPLVEALEVAASVVSERSRGRVDRLREAVAAGASFAEACESVGGFDGVTIAVYRAAERTGDLAGAAERLAKATRRRLAIRGKAITVLIYPAVVVTISVVMFLALLIFLVPKIADQVTALNPTVPWFSEIVFAVGRGLRDNLGWAAAALLIAAMGVVVLWRRVVAMVGGLARRLPGVGSLLLTVEMTRFFSVMGAMTRSGVTLADALVSATGVISEGKLREELEWLGRSLVEGGVLRSLIEKVEALPLATRRLLIAAERSGDLDQAFDAIADDMADEVDKQSGRLLALLEPGVILVMFMLLGPLIIAIAIPLMTFRSGT